MNLTNTFSLFRDAFRQWQEDKAGRLGAALSYYSIFSLAPLLMITIGIVSLIYGEQAARGEMVREIERTVGEPAALAIQELLKTTRDSGSSTMATIIGLAMLLFGASGVFIQLQDALNTIWKVSPPSGLGLIGIVRDRVLSFTAVLGTGFLLLVSLVVSAGLTALSRFLTPDAVPGGIFLWQTVTGLVSLGIIALLFAMLFKLLPAAPLRWRDVWGGALVAALLFTLGKHLLGLYLGRSGTASAFGAAGSLVVIMIWVYYSAQVFLYGAEFTRAQFQKNHEKPSAGGLPHLQAKPTDVMQDA